MKRIIGVDQSLTSTGICIIEDGVKIHSEIVTTSPDKEDPLDVFHRSRFIARQIMGVAYMYNVKSVVLEGLSYGSVSSSTRKLATLQALIVDRFLTDGYEVVIIEPTKLKKFATGKGNANKDAMFEALPDDIREEFGSVPKTKGRFDLTDAYFLAQYSE